MITIQDRFLRRIDDIVALNNGVLEIVKSVQHGNVGSLFILDKQDNSYAKVKYNFQPSDVSFSLRTQGVLIDFCFNYEETEKWNAFKKILETVVRKRGGVQPPKIDATMPAKVYLMGKEVVFYSEKDGLLPRKYDVNEFTKEILNG